MPVEPLNFTERGGRIWLENEDWPEQTEFSKHVLAAPSDYILYRRGLVELRLTDARAIYRLQRRDPTKDTYVGDLVYSERHLAR